MVQSELNLNLMKRQEHFFCAKTTKQRLYSTIRLLWFSVVPFWRISTGRKQRTLFEETNCWIKSFSFFAQKKCSRRFIKFRLNHWWQMDYSDDAFHTFTFTFIFTFMHLADAFIQSDLHCIQVAVFFFFLHLTSSCFLWESNPWCWHC